MDAQAFECQMTHRVKGLNKTYPIPWISSMKLNKTSRHSNDRKWPNNRKYFLVLLPVSCLSFSRQVRFPESESQHLVFDFTPFPKICTHSLSIEIWRDSHPPLACILRPSSADLAHWQTPLSMEGLSFRIIPSIRAWMNKFTVLFPENTHESSEYIQNLWILHKAADKVAKRQTFC